MEFVMKITPKIRIVSPVVLAILVIGIGAVLFDHKSPEPQTKGAFTTAATPSTKIQPVSSNSATVAPATVTTAVSRPAKLPTSTPNKPQVPTTTAPVTPPVQPTPTPTPNPQPTPAPTPGFHITLRTDGAVTQDVIDGFGVPAHQLIVKFDVVFDEGFVATSFDMPDCNFTVTPADDYHVLCNVSQKEADSGFLSIQFYDSSAPGHYEVEVTYPVNGIVATDTLAFDLN